MIFSEKQGSVVLYFYEGCVIFIVLFLGWGNTSYRTLNTRRNWAFVGIVYTWIYVGFVWGGAHVCVGGVHVDIH